MALFCLTSVKTKAQDQARVHLLCRWGDQVVRTLRLEKKGTVYVTYYLRSRTETPVSRTVSYEEALLVLKRIQANLEKGNYKCQDISDSGVSEAPGVSTIKDKPIGETPTSTDEHAKPKEIQGTTKVPPHSKRSSQPSPTHTPYPPMENPENLAPGKISPEHPTPPKKVLIPDSEG